MIVRQLDGSGQMRIWKQRHWINYVPLYHVNWKILQSIKSICKWKISKVVRYQHIYTLSNADL